MCRRRRPGRRALRRAAGLAVLLLGLGLVGSGVSEELLAALLAAWLERGGAATDAGFADSAGFADGAGLADGVGFAKGGGVANGAGLAAAAGFANRGGFANDAGLANGAGFANGGGFANNAGFANGAGLAAGAGFADGGGFAIAGGFAKGAGIARYVGTANGGSSATGGGFANGVGFAKSAGLANAVGIAGDAGFAIAAGLADSGHIANNAAAAGITTGASSAIGVGAANLTGPANSAPVAGGVPALGDTPVLGGIPVLVSPPGCGDPAPFLLLLVPSAPSHSAQRQAVRDTWGGSGGAGGLPTRTLFGLGLPAGGGAAGAAVLAEARRHGDVVQGAFADTYANLTRKTLLLLGWAAARCPGARFILKADDDAFVHVPALLSLLRASPAPARLYLGRVHWRVRPERDPRGRHHVPASLYAAAAFPPYCSGSAYVLSAPAVAAVLAAAPRVPAVGPEDVFVGLCARRAGLAPRHSARMAGAARFPLDPCCYGGVLLSAHRLQPPELRRAWELARGGEAACSPLQRALGVLRCKALAALQGLWS